MGGAGVRETRQPMNTGVSWRPGGVWLVGIGPGLGRPREFVSTPLYLGLREAKLTGTALATRGEWLGQQSVVDTLVARWMARRWRERVEEERGRGIDTERRSRATEPLAATEGGKPTGDLTWVHRIGCEGACEVVVDADVANAWSPSRSAPRGGITRRVARLQLPGVLDTQRHREPERPAL